MKQSFCAALLLAGVFHIASAQLKAPPGSLSGIVSAGYGSDVSADVSETYDALVQNIRAFGIPLQTQTKFGRTFVANAGILYNRYESIGIGISLGYSFSPAYSVYEDNAGTLRLNGSVHSYQIALRARAIPEHFGIFPFILNMQFGACRTAVDFTQEVRFKSGQDAHADWNLSTSAWAPFFQATIGTAITLPGDLSLGIEGGYEYAFTRVNNAEMDPLETAKDQLGKELGPYGIVVLVSLGIVL